jgi:hypothetical protein
MDSLITRFSPQTQQSLRQAYAEILIEIQDRAAENVILSTDDVSNIIDLFIEHNDLDEIDEEDPYPKQLGQYLLGQDLVYQFGDANSYLSRVRSQGKISNQEHGMIDSLSRRKVIFRDTEFPVDPDGRYNIPISLEQINEMLTSGQIASFDPNPNQSVTDPRENVTEIRRNLVKFVGKNGKDYYVEARYDPADNKIWPV